MKILLLSLCVVMANASLAPLRVSNGRSVPDSWIVAVKDIDQLERVEADIRSAFVQFRSPSPKVTKIENLTPALIMKIPAQMINRVRMVEGIDYIQQDILGTIYGSQSGATWGIDRIDSRSGTDDYYNYNDNALGSGAKIFIVDTGIQTSHIVFNGRASLLYGASDDHGHGTHCGGTAGGTIVGIARKAQVFSVKVCNQYGQCPISTVIAGLNAIVGKHGTGDGSGVVSMSLGWAGNPTVDSFTKNMITKGYTVSVAAGNDDQDACGTSPARVPEAITAGASDVNDKRAYFSNYGSCLDLFAPGVDIFSAGYSTSSNNQGAYMSGTSMACPHVTGASAVYLGSHPGSSPQQVHNAIVAAATTNAISDTKGSPNRFLYVNPG